MVSVYNDVKGLYLVCYICHESDHLAKDCPSLHYVVKKDAFIAKTYSNKRIPYERNRSIKKFYSYHILENRALLIQANLDNMTVYEYETESDVAPQPAETERMSTAALETEEAGASPVLRKTVSVVQDKDEMNIPLDLTEPGQNRNKRYPIEKYKIWPFEIGFDKIENFNHYFEHNNFKNITFIPSEHHVPEASILEEDDDDELLAHMNNGDNFLGL